MSEIVLMSGVAIVLVLSLYTVYAVGALSRRLNGEESDSSSSANTGAVARPVAENGIPRQTVAVISAAIAAYMAQSAPGVPYAVTGISRRVSGARPVWGFAGMRQNTEPF